MERPISLTSRGVDLSEQLRTMIEERAQRLERFYPRLIGCSVVIEGPGHRHRNGGPYAVALDLRVPGADPLLVTRRKEPNLEAAIDSVVVRAHDLATVCGSGEGGICDPDAGAAACPAEPTTGRGSQVW